MVIKHVKVSTKLDSADRELIQPSDWNMAHVIEGGGGIGKEIYASDFLFNQQGSTSLAAGNLTNVVLSPVPFGLNATNYSHYVYIKNVDHPELSEAVVISGGTAVGGASSGVIQITTVNNHSFGEWVIESATCGISEAVNSVTGPIKVNVDYSGNMYGPVIIRDRSFVHLSGSPSVILTAKFGISALQASPFQFIGSTDIQGGNEIEGIFISGTDKDNSPQSAIVVDRQYSFRIKNCNISAFYGGITYTNGSYNCLTENVFIHTLGNTGYGFWLVNVNSSNWTNCFIDGTNKDADGFRFISSQRIRIDNCEIINCAEGIFIRPSGTVIHTRISNCSIHDCNLNGIRLDISIGSSRIIGTQIIGSRIYNCKDTGIRLVGIPTATAGYISSLIIKGCDISGNFASGIASTSEGGASRHIKYVIVQGNMLGDNSQGNATPLYGMAFEGDIKSLNVSGNTFSNTDYDYPEGEDLGFKMAACVRIFNGAFENLVITGNCCVRCMGGANPIFIDAGAGGNKYVEGNIWVP